MRQGKLSQQLLALGVAPIEIIQLGRQIEDDQVGGIGSKPLNALPEADHQQGVADS